MGGVYQGLRGELSPPPHEATYFQAFLDGGYCGNNMLNGWWAFNDKSDMLLTLLMSKKVEYLLSFSCLPVTS